MTHIAHQPPDLPLDLPGVPQGDENAVAGDHSGNDSHSYRPLALVIATNGHQYEQVRREGDLAIYRGRNRDGLTVTWEVVRIRTVEASVMPGGYEAPAREVYPSSEQWGTHGWTCFTLDEAESKMRQLMEVA